MHCQCHFDKSEVKLMFKRRHRTCGCYVTSWYRLDRKWYHMGYHTNVCTPPGILFVEICDLRMHPNTSVGFS